MTYWFASLPLPVLCRLLCKWMTYWFASESILRFFKTGVFEWKAPFRGVTVRYTCKEAPETIDW